MGQKPSQFALKVKVDRLPHLGWVLGGEGRRTTRHPNPEQPIKFQYKTKRKEGASAAAVQIETESAKKTADDVKCKIIKTQNVPSRTKSEPSLSAERTRERRRRRKKSARSRKSIEGNVQQFGYEIEDVDAFLSKATIEEPANIPVVLALPAVLYRTRAGGHQSEVRLPLGTVVNAVFKNDRWLYVQTPHAEEGYVSYAVCLPLGIIPSTGKATPRWEDTTDVFPKPSGNMTDTEKLSSRSCCSGGGGCRTRKSTCSERSLDVLYLRAARKRGTTRQTLLVVCKDYEGRRADALAVRKGEVVVLLSAEARGWFWVRSRDGAEGFIPAEVAGHGFL